VRVERTYIKDGRKFDPCLWATVPTQTKSSVFEAILLLWLLRRVTFGHMDRESWTDDATSKTLEVFGWLHYERGAII